MVPTNMKLVLRANTAPGTVACPGRPTAAIPPEEEPAPPEDDPAPPEELPGLLEDVPTEAPDEPPKEEPPPPDPTTRRN